MCLKLVDWLVVVLFILGWGRLWQVILLLCKTVVTWACLGQCCCAYMETTLLLEGLFDCETEMWPS